MFDLPFDRDHPLEWSRSTYRLLLVCAPSNRAPGWEEQLLLLDGQEQAFAERDLLMGKLLVEGTSILDERHLPDEAVAQMRRRLDIPEKTFCVLLVDKDGRVMMHEDAPVKPAYLYEVIDATPTRQHEMSKIDTPTDDDLETVPVTESP